MKLPRFLLLCYVCITFASPVRGQVVAPPKSIYMVRYNTFNGWRLEVVVNGVPVLDRSMGGGQMPVENLVPNGADKLSIKATQLNENTQPLELTLVSVDTATGKATEVSQFTAKPGKQGDTVAKVLDFQGAVPMQWTWEKAEEVKTLTAADQDEIYGLVKKMLDGLNAKDARAQAELRAVFIDEVSRFQGMDRAKVEAQVAQMYKAPEGVTAQWQARAKEELNIATYGKVTVVSAKQPYPDNWTITLKITPEQSTSITDILFAKIGGKWVIVN